MPPQVLPLSAEELQQALRLVDPPVYGPGGICGLCDMPTAALADGACPNCAHDNRRRKAHAILPRAIATIEALQAENEAAKVRAYRALRIVEPNMDQYAGACAVYSAAFETLEPPTLAESELDSLHSQLDTQAQELARVRAELTAVRELMNTYNLGGWTDAVAPMQRALEAEAVVVALRGPGCAYHRLDPYPAGCVDCADARKDSPR